MVQSVDYSQAPQHHNYIVHNLFIYVGKHNNERNLEIESNQNSSKGYKKHIHIYVYVCIYMYTYMNIHVYVHKDI